MWPKLNIGRFVHKYLMQEFLHHKTIARKFLPVLATKLLIKPKKIIDSIYFSFDTISVI